MSSTKAPFQTQSAVAGDRRSQRRRSAKPERPSRRRDLRGLWRTTLALIAPLPGLLMAAKIIVSPFGVRNDLADVLAGVSGDPAREQLAQSRGAASPSLCCPRSWLLPGPHAAERPGLPWSEGCLV